VEAWLRVTGAKAITNLIDLLYPLDAKHAKPPWRMKRRHVITEHVSGGSTVYTIAPKEAASTQHVYFLHGGAYYNGFIPDHWVFIDDIVTKSKCTITAPDYPLAPDGNVDDIFAMVFPLYQKLLVDHGAANLTVIGDSSGGGMALALAQKARDAGVPQPKELVLLSPWLDVTMTNPDIKESNR
jgi:acetyl esterase/lipase